MKNQPFRLVATNADSADVSYALTIAVPTFKRAGLLEETLRSIAAVKFSVQVEVIVVDNDPDGDDVQAARLVRDVLSGPYRYYRNCENVGMFGNWNQCLFQARGKYITILHDDDLLCAQFGTAVDRLLVNGCLAHEIAGFQIMLLEQRPDRLMEQAALAAHVQQPSDTADINQEMTQQLFPVTDLFFSNPFCGTLAVVFNREQAIALGGFEATWYPIADYEFWCRWATRYGAIPIVNWRVAQYRIGQNESMKLETRTAFVTKSRELRHHLIERRTVPAMFAALVGIVSFSQRSQIYRDWRSLDEPPLSMLRNFAMRCSGKAMRIVARLTKSPVSVERQAAVEST